MSDIHHEHVSHASEEKAHSALNTKMIWKVFWILLGVTIFEVGISFTGVPPTILLYTFIVLTLVKAYYIVGYFMHMKFEEVPLQWSILLPFVLIVYLIFIAIYE
jgi:cytochrome c oxidase subunit IV